MILIQIRTKKLDLWGQRRNQFVWIRISVCYSSIAGLQIYGGPGSLSHDFKIWPITFQGNGPSGPILFSCEKSHFSKNFHLTASLQTPQNRKYMSLINTVKPALSSHSKKDKTKILITNGSLMKVERIAECSPWSILQYFWPTLSDNWSSFLSGHLRQILLYNQQMSTVVSLICLGPSFQKMTHHFLLHGSLRPTNLEKNLKPWHCADQVTHL